MRTERGHVREAGAFDECWVPLSIFSIPRCWESGMHTLCNLIMPAGCLLSRFASDTLLLSGVPRILNVEVEGPLQ